MEGRLVNHSSCIGVVSRTYGRLVGDRDGGMHVGQSQVGLVAYLEMLEHIPRAK